MCWMTRSVMSARVCTVAVAMLPTSVATSTASATTVSTAGLPSTPHRVPRTIAVSSRRMEIVQGPSISSHLRHV